jgi:hypothetical protein
LYQLCLIFVNHLSAKSALITIKTVHNDFYISKRLLYDQCGFELTEPIAESESSEYGACHFKLNGHEIKFRVSKITPTKTGQFVTIWKRDEQGVTRPFSETDELDFFIICSRSNENFGVFMFPKALLVEKGIITGKGKEGKRGIRVYPPWDKPTSKQAEKTQGWQTRYFFSIHQNKSADVAAVKKLLSGSTQQKESNIT